MKERTRHAIASALFEIVTDDPYATEELLDAVAGPGRWIAPNPHHLAHLVFEPLPASRGTRLSGVGPTTHAA